MGHTISGFCAIFAIIASLTNGQAILKNDCLTNTSNENDVLLRMKQLEMAFISQQKQMLDVIRELKSEVKADLSKIEWLLNGKYHILSICQ